MEKGKSDGIREAKINFLEALIKILPELINETKKKMIATGTRILSLESKEDPQDNDARLSIRTDELLEFHHLFSRANLDEENGVVHLYDFINTYPNRKNCYYSLFCGDLVNFSFERAYKMHKSITSFLN